jgi:hypothetical protein
MHLWSYRFIQLVRFTLPLMTGASHERSVRVVSLPRGQCMVLPYKRLIPHSVEAHWHQKMSDSSRFSSRSPSPLSPDSPLSLAATPGPDWSPRPGMPIDLHNGSLPGSTAVSPSWSPAQGSLILGVESPPQSPRSSSGELLDEAISKYPDTAAVACAINPRYYFNDQISYFKVNSVLLLHSYLAG